MENVKRVYVVKRPGFDTESKNLLKDLKENLNLDSLENLRIFVRYDISGLSDKEFQEAVNNVLSESPADLVYFEGLEICEGEHPIAVEYLPGQYDQRADSAAQSIQIITLKKKPLVFTAKVYVLKGELNESEIKKIKDYLINPVDSREAALEKPEKLEKIYKIPGNVKVISGFINMDHKSLDEFRRSEGLAMSPDDLLFCRDHFLSEEKRDPTITEIKILDTYWSDHCRHTTFETKINKVNFEHSEFNDPVIKSYENIKDSFKEIYKNKNRDLTLMSIATMSMKEMLKNGKLNDLEISGEINACSIERDILVDGKPEKWLIMFKNETHNHPTEIEPFGGAATCLGGAIRDPLSGRAYVYQAMRVTGSGDPRTPVSSTIPGKLPQKKITREAARGYSSYGNQIGVATGLVSEIYNEGYIAKRMEVGAVVGAVAKNNVLRQEPDPGDIILLVGGKTGRDGIGGATGSSKEHDENSILTAGAEVQKGNPPEERKLQRLFRDPEVIRMIKKCNDFGAGGVSVAIGELADGLDIYLDRVPKKYEGLDGTELALSESQERMAVVIRKENKERFLLKAEGENLDAVEIAEVTGENRLKMFWRGEAIANISRKFLDTNGVRQSTDILVKAPDPDKNFFRKKDHFLKPEQSPKTKWINKICNLNIAGQKGLTDMFDSTVGAGTVLMPMGGKFASTPLDIMAAKVPVWPGEAGTATIMSYGFDPEISVWSPYHGALYSVVEAVSKIVAAGGEFNNVRTSLQEYFEKLGKNSEKWGKPFSALTGAYQALKEFEIAAIGGKDSMSGSFKELNVPPTLITFALDTVNVGDIISPEFKKPGNVILMFRVSRDQYEIPDFSSMRRNYSLISKNIKEKNILSAFAVTRGGVAEALSKMSFGNRIGFTLDDSFRNENLFTPDYGSIIFEVEEKKIKSGVLEGIEYETIGITTNEDKIRGKNFEIGLNELQTAWEGTLKNIFPTGTDEERSEAMVKLYKTRNMERPGSKFGKPRIFIPVFPGTNCEFDTAGAFERAGGVAKTSVFNNLTPEGIKRSLEVFKKEIDNSQIIAIPGGFSAGDEPDGSGKFIAAVFRNPVLSKAVLDLLNKRDGLMIGICNGFQALIKLGLVPYGEIRDLCEDSPTLTFNSIGRHVSVMVNTKVVSALSPWFIRSQVGDIHTIPVSHGEGRFVAGENIIKELEANGQIATQYVDLNGKPSYDIENNPNGSFYAVEGITSPDGRIFGKMGHSERVGLNTFKNVPGNKDQKIFESGIEYFK
ncbi:MAG: phosphoribosylformylglycinamidine synthase [Acidobacteriota bacterium]